MFIIIIPSYLRRDRQSLPLAILQRLALFYYTHHRASVSIDNYNKFPKKGSGGSEKKTSNTYYISGQYVPKNKVDKDVKLLNQNPNTIPAQIAWNGLKWRKQNGQYQVFDTDKGAFVNTTKNDLRLNLSFDETVGYKAGVSSTSKMTIQEANNIVAGKAGPVPLEKIEEAKALLGQTSTKLNINTGFDPNNLSGKKLLD